MANGGGLLLAEMTSPQVRAAVAEGRSTIVVPFGALEQHGPHLPLDTDSVLGDQLGALLARRLGALCAPTLRIGCSAHHLAFAGTLSLRPETLRMIVHDVVHSLAEHGFRRIILLPTHGGNEQPLAQAAAQSRRDGVTVVVPSLRLAVAALLADAQARGAPVGDAGGHAGELETSLMLALAPHLVTTASMEPGYTGPLDEATTRLLFDKGIAALSANGVVGDPRGATPDAGRAYIAAFLDAVERQLP
jgi:creatinine amidohydrolase